MSFPVLFICAAFLDCFYSLVGSGFAKKMSCLESNWCHFSILIFSLHLLFKFIVTAGYLHSLIVLFFMKLKSRNCNCYFKALPKFTIIFSSKNYIIALWRIKNSELQLVLDFNILTAIYFIYTNWVKLFLLFMLLF